MRLTDNKIILIQKKTRLEGLILRYNTIEQAKFTSRVYKKEAAAVPVKNLPWDSDYLTYSVREPFPSKTTGASLVFGAVSSSAPLKITSYMPENGVIFSDGIESDYVQFNAGVEATISVAEKRGHLIQ